MARQIELAIFLPKRILAEMDNDPRALLGRIISGDLSARQALFVAEVWLSKKPSSFSDFRSSLGISHSNLSRLAGGLEKRGVLKIEKNEADPRKRDASLTPEGKRMARELFNPA